MQCALHRSRYASVPNDGLEIPHAMSSIIPRHQKTLQALLNLYLKQTPDTGQDREHQDHLTSMWSHVLDSVKLGVPQVLYFTSLCCMYL